MPTLPYSERVDAVARLLAEADLVLIGAGAGLSAAAGLNYQDPALFARWYPQFGRLGIRTIWEAITAHWAPDDTNRRRFWAFLVTPHSADSTRTHCSRPRGITESFNATSPARRSRPERRQRSRLSSATSLRRGRDAENVRAFRQGRHK
jgi:hypothetical protein